MIKGLNYDYNSDYYRLGGMIYFIIFKVTPNTIKEKNNITDISIIFNTTLNYSQSCQDFINKLIVNDNTKRIGFHNIEELKNHEFFKNFDWENFEKRKIKSPFPKIERKSIGLCNKTFEYKRHPFIKTSFLKNKTFTNFFFTYDSINHYVTYKIFRKFKFKNYKK